MGPRGKGGSSSCWRWRDPSEGLGAAAKSEMTPKAYVVFAHSSAAAYGEADGVELGLGELVGTVFLPEVLEEVAERGLAERALTPSRPDPSGLFGGGFAVHRWNGRWPVPERSYTR